VLPELPKSICQQAGGNMNRTTVQKDHKWGSYFLTARGTLGFLTLLICCSAAALAQNVGQTKSSTAPVGIRVTHLLGFENAPSNASGTLSIQETALQFEKTGRPALQVQIASIQDIFVGEQSKQVGGVPMTLGKTATPFGGGRVVSLFAHKKYDTLALEYVDGNGGVHGAIFQLNKGQGEVLRNELVARGAHVSRGGDKPTEQGTVEVASESN
jgi:hypothetical protein